MDDIKQGYTRVTEPLNKYVDFSNISEDVLNNAAKRGTRVHSYCESYAKGEWFPDPDEEIAGYISSFTKWFNSMVEKVLFLELRLYSDVYMLTGAVDAIAILKGDSKPTIIDYKTPASPSKSWQLQTAAYLFLAQGYEGLDIKRRIALQLFKNGNLAKPIEYTNHENDWHIYKGILNAHRFFNA